MSVVEDRSRGRRKLLTAIRIVADVEPQTTIRTLRPVLVTLLGTLLRFMLRTFVLLYVLIAARGAAHDTIRPAHFFDISEALLISGEVFVNFADVHEPRLAQVSFCVK